MIDDPSFFSVCAFFSFWLGASIASFLNVVIWRVPRGESIVSPPSHCPKCNAAIRWYQNIPILAWLALRGRCANCREPISPRYVLVELLGGLLFLATFWWYWPGLDTTVPALFAHWALNQLVVWIWISLMIAGSFIDFDHQLLPDFVTVGGMVLGLAFNGVISILLRTPSCILLSLAGLVLGFGLLWLIRFFGSKAFGREAMGMGDVFLMGAVGALFGPVAVLVTVVLSSLVGSVVGLALIALAKARLGGFTAIPFGPYICLGCLGWMFFGTELVNWYVGFFR